MDFLPRSPILGFVPGPYGDFYLQTRWLSPLSKNPASIICTLMEALEYICSLCRARHPGVSGLKLPLSPPLALCMRGREGLIWVQKYVKGPVQNTYHILMALHSVWMPSKYLFVRSNVLSTQYRNRGSPHMELTGQFTDKPTRSQSSRELRGHLAHWITCRLDDSWTSQLAEMVRRKIWSK